MDAAQISTSEVFARFNPSRENLIPILHALQEQNGFLTPETLAQAAQYLDMSLSEVYGVATFYTRFRFKPSGRRYLRVCLGTACHVKGAGEVLKELEKRLGIKPGETTPNGAYSLETEACFGSCALAPVVLTDETVHGRMDPSRVGDLLRSKE